MNPPSVSGSGRPSRAAALAAVAAQRAHQENESQSDEEDYMHEDDEEDAEDEEDEAEEEEDGEEGEHDAATSHARGHSHHGSSSRSASQKKSRITQACDSCRRRKRKCDGRQPICSSCDKLRLECNYQTTVKKRGPQAGVVKRLRQEVKQLETELHREKRKAKLGGITPGVVPEANTNRKRLHRAEGADGNTVMQPSSSSPPAEEDLGIHSLNAAANSRVRNDTYLNTYFNLLNNTMFPLLEEKNFYEELKRYEQDPTLEVPLSWNLRYAAALSVGSMIYGDEEYAQASARVARHAASQLFDQPDALVLRGMLVLAFHCLSTNQQSRAACYLAVATRMCLLVDISPEIPPLATFFEDMLCSINWWYTGLDILPEGAYKAQQTATYPADKLEYEKLLATENAKITLIENTELGNTKKSSPATASGATSGSNATPATAGEKTAADMSLTSPTPTSAAGESASPVVSTSANSNPDEDASLRWEMLKVMCFTSGVRGELNKPPSFSVYRCLYILTKALISPLTVGAIRTLILYFRVVCKALVLDTPDDMETMVHDADLASDAGQQHDCTHCPFYSLCFHVIAQVHLMSAESNPDKAEPLLVQDYDIVEKVSLKWNFGLPMLQNLQARIMSRYLEGGKKPKSPALQTLLERIIKHASKEIAAAKAGETLPPTSVNASEGPDDVSRLSDPDRSRASLIYNNSSIPAISNKPTPSIVDTMNALNEKFGTTLRLTDAELTEMNKIKKGLTEGIHAPGTKGISTQVNMPAAPHLPPMSVTTATPIIENRTIDSHFSHAPTVPMQPTSVAFPMSSSANPAYLNPSSSPELMHLMNPSPTITRPGLEELMKYEIGPDELPLSSDLQPEVTVMRPTGSPMVGGNNAQGYMDPSVGYMGGMQIKSPLQSFPPQSHLRHQMAPMQQSPQLQTQQPHPHLHQHQQPPPPHHYSQHPPQQHQPQQQQQQQQQQQYTPPSAYAQREYELQKQLKQLLQQNSSNQQQINYLQQQQQALHSQQPHQQQSNYGGGSGGSTGGGSGLSPQQLSQLNSLLNANSGYNPRHSQPSQQQQQPQHYQQQSTPSYQQYGPESGYGSYNTPSQSGGNMNQPSNMQAQYSRGGYLRGGGAPQQSLPGANSNYSMEGMNMTNPSSASHHQSGGGGGNYSFDQPNSYFNASGVGNFDPLMQPMPGSGNNNQQQQAFMSPDPPTQQQSQRYPPSKGPVGPSFSQQLNSMNAAVGSFGQLPNQ